MKTAEQILNHHYKKTFPILKNEAIAAMEEYAFEKSEEIANAMAKGAEQWKAEYDNCRKILEGLVKLKHIKDTYGKTPYYLEWQPVAWETAKEFLKKYQHNVE